MQYSAQEMIEFASWFQTAHGDENTEPTLEDLKLWEEGKEDWSGRS